MTNQPPPALFETTPVDEAGQIVQLQAHLADLELQIEQLTTSRDQARDQVSRMLAAHKAQAAELAQANRCSRAWKETAKRWRQEANQMSLALDHTAANCEDLYEALREENQRLRANVQLWMGGFEKVCWRLLQVEWWAQAWKQIAKENWRVNQAVEQYAKNLRES